MFPLLALIAALASPEAGAERLTVDASGSGDHLDIQDAVDAAAPGDHIVVLAGTYGPVDLSAWSGPIVGLDGAALTWIDAGSASTALSHSAEGRSTVVGLTLSGGADAGVSVSAGTLRLWRSWAVDGGSAVEVSGGALELAGVALGGVDLGVSVSGGEVTVEGAALLAHPDHFAFTGGAFDGRHLVVFGGDRAATSCGSPDVALSHSLFTLESAPACATTSSMYLGFEPDFVHFSDDGDWTNDDLSLSGGSVAIDAGAADCSDPDGTVCDLGMVSGEVGAATDSDGDGMPDAWEDAWGSDTALDDGTADPDGDGLDSLGEYLYETDPLGADSDGDGVDDLDELQAGFDPLDGSDQAPTAALADPGNGFLGEAMVLDGAASSDPVGEALTYAWRIDEQPADSALSDAALGSGPTAALTPDAAGTWTVTLTVDDGLHSDSATASFEVLTGRVVSIPGDYPDWASLPLADGLEVVFGAGEHAWGGSLDEDPDLTVRGQGIGETTLAGDLTLSAGTLRLRDLSMAGESAALTVQDGAWADLHRVSLSAEVGLLVQDAGVVSGWGVEAEGGDRGIDVSGGVLRLASSSLAGNSEALFAWNNSAVQLQGVVAKGGEYGLFLQDSRSQLSHLSARADRSALSFSGGEAEADQLHLEGGVWGMACSGGRFRPEMVLLSSESGGTSGCQAMSWFEVDSVPMAADGSPQEGSAAIDGGDWREEDPDGSRADLGGWGGPRAWGQSPELEGDADGDGIEALTEYALGSSDASVDSDGDGVGDLDELLAGDDPADATDRAPAVEAPTVRALLCDEASLTVRWGEDPDGDDCDFAWGDGETSATRSLTAGEPGAEDWPWTLVCGESVLEGAVTLLVQEERTVPAEPGALEEAALDAAEHEVLVLAAGEHEGADLSGLPLALRGEGPETVIDGPLVLSDPALAVEDLRIRGDAQMDGGALTRVEVLGDLLSAEAALTNVLVDGELGVLEGGALAHLTVDGRARVEAEELYAAAVTGPASLGGTPRAQTLTGLDEDDRPFIDWAEDPEEATLLPWPGSPLWDAADPERGLDPDSSDPDIGYSGGPEAAPVDLDGDGLTDAWEALEGVDDPDDDPDGDGLSNAEEFARLTDPLDADTDGDGLDDATDPDPLDPEAGSIRASLSVDDRFPAPGQRVFLSAEASRDPSGGSIHTGWRLSVPEGSAAALEVDGDRAWFTPDREGRYHVAVSLRSEMGAAAELGQDVWVPSERRVSSSAQLEEALDEAPAGTRIVLEEGNFQVSARVDRDLVIRHAEGATVGVIDADGGAVFSVVDGATLRLENLTVRGGESSPALQALDARLELRQARVLGGSHAFDLDRAELELISGAVLGSLRVGSFTRSLITLRNAVLGWPEEEAGAPFWMWESEARLEGVILGGLDGESEAPLAFLGAGSRLSLSRSLLPDGLPDPRRVALDRVHPEAPSFFLAPEEADNLFKVDLRLYPGSPGRNAGPRDDPDPDGSPNDVGVFGGLWADWPDVDNDRDGWTNLEGDCDDADPDWRPDAYTGECVGPGGCATGGGGGAAWWLVLAVAGVLGRAQRRGRHHTPG